MPIVRSFKDPKMVIITKFLVSSLGVLPVLSCPPQLGHALFQQLSSTEIFFVLTRSIFVARTSTVLYSFPGVGCVLQVAVA